MVKMCYGIPVTVTPEDGTFHPRMADVQRAVTSATKAIIVNSPNNPSGNIFSDESITENTRGSYRLDHINNAVLEKRAGHPKNIVLLTCGASGMMPLIAKLTPEQAMYQFISGYTSKLAGTAVGLGKEPEITFSTCFGGPFMVHHPSVYAELLRRKIMR